MLRQNIHAVNIAIRRNSLYGIFQRPSPTFILPNNRALLYPYGSIYVQKSPTHPFIPAIQPIIPHCMILWKKPRRLVK